MQTLSRRLVLAFILGAMLTVMGCGQKGDLYLPEGNAQAVMAG
jgi:predicted small lipoprotein YifL